ncbi:hypothetical protein [Streptomyces sp. NBC_01233]|uniref:hypothetical protein n=1 Tax=Streptomyces sp. NBC_01233 TaxID=2903787 RepID=UPI002E14B268|nr:hypothetical protein OG332_05395 [Streptomyces sp. NBC_01233]
MPVKYPLHPSGVLGRQAEPRGAQPEPTINDEADGVRFFVREIALAVEAVCEPERTYLYSLGSQQGNAHLHWHVAALPSGVPTLSSSSTL